MHNKVSILLTEFFDKMNFGGIKYCVMNNYEDMPEVIPTDVDIAIESQAFQRMDVFLEEFCNNNGVEIIQKIWHGYYKCAYILSPLKIDGYFRLQLDFFTDFGTKNFFKLIPNKIILKRKNKFKNFYIPDPEVELLFLFMRRVIKNDLRESHINKLRFLMNKKPENIKERLFKIFGEELGTSIIKIIESGDEAIFRANLNNYRKALKKWSKKNTSLYHVIKCGTSLIRRIINRLIHVVGFSVVFLSPDGGGKSTIANLVLERVSGSFHGGRIQYWRPHLLPAMGRLKFWNPSKDIKTNPQPHAYPKQNPFKSIIRFLYYLTDYLIGYPVKIYWAKVKKNIIIFDRYYYDYFIDLHRYQFNIPKWLPRFFLPIIPSPDMTIYLDAEPEELLSRKQELSLSELKRQVEEYRKIIKKIPKSFIVQTNQPVDDLVKKISYLILKKKTEQTKKLLKSAD